MILEYVQERDIDLLILRAFYEDESFRTFIKEELDIKSPFSKATHSIRDDLGETDITVFFENQLLLIENKIAADFQEDQKARYEIRAARSNAKLLLIAPNDYLEATEPWPYMLSYEQLIEHVEDDFTKLILKQAIEQDVYVKQPNEQITGFWSDYLDALEGRGLELPKREPRGSRSLWITIRKNGVRVIHKMPEGYLDIEGEHEGGERIEFRSGTYTRFVVPKLDLSKPFKTQREKIEEIIERISSV